MKQLLKIGLTLIGIVIALGIVGFLGIQLIPVHESNPPVVSEPAWDSPQTQALVKRACYDCHSNETTWPWYSRVAPVSWLVAHDVEEGRSALNFSEWGSNQGGEGGERGEGGEQGEGGEDREGGEGGEGAEIDDLVEVVQEGEMPPQKYLLMHPEAKLSDAEIKALVTGLEATFGGSAQSFQERTISQK